MIQRSECTSKWSNDSVDKKAKKYLIEVNRKSDRMIKIELNMVGTVKIVCVYAS